MLAILPPSPRHCEAKYKKAEAILFPRWAAGLLRRLPPRNDEGNDAKLIDVMIPIFEVSGRPYEMGFQIGRKAKRFIRPSALFYQTNWKKLHGRSFDFHLTVIDQMIEDTAQLLPKTFDELRGIADGSGVDFKVLFLINASEALDQFKKPERCTSVLVGASKTKSGQLLLAHNEDWISSDGRFLYLLRCRPVDEPALLAFTYGAWIPQYGVNAWGLAFVADSNTATDVHRGLSQTMIGREVMRCENITQAKNLIQKLPRADGHSYVLATPTDGVILETTGRKTEALKISTKSPIFVHTNFYQGKITSKLEREKRTHSRARQKRVSALVNAEKSLIDESTLRRALNDRSNKRYPVCGISSDLTEESTIAQLVIRPANRSLEIVAGNPCNGRLRVSTFVL